MRGKVHIEKKGGSGDSLPYSAGLNLLIAN